jgi:prepilin-type N-terminal cleavage/methylation domain-containing protein
MSMIRTSSLRGFTLIEMIVSVGLFSVVIVMVSTAYLNLIALDRVTRATSDAMNNLNFAVDSMSRSIRTGTAYHCNGNNGNSDCWPGASNTLNFINDQNQRVWYLLSNNQIYECVGTGNCDTNNGRPITDPKVVINNLDFYVQGVSTNDGVQPEVLLVVNASVSAGGGHNVTFTIQTTASERGLQL